MKRRNIATTSRPAVKYRNNRTFLSSFASNKRFQYHFNTVHWQCICCRKANIDVWGCRIWLVNRFCAKNSIAHKKRTTNHFLMPYTHCPKPYIKLAVSFYVTTSTIYLPSCSRPFGRVACLFSQFAKIIFIFCFWLCVCVCVIVCASMSVCARSQTESSKHRTPNEWTVKQDVRKKFANSQMWRAH